MKSEGFDCEDSHLSQSSFFETPEVGIIAIICVTLIGENLEIVANQMNLNTNLDLSKVYLIQTNVTGIYF